MAVLEGQLDFSQHLCWLKLTVLHRKVDHLQPCCWWPKPDIFGKKSDHLKLFSWRPKPTIFNIKLNHLAKRNQLLVTASKLISDSFNGNRKLLFWGEVGPFLCWPKLCILHGMEDHLEPCHWPSSAMLLATKTSYFFIGIWSIFGIFVPTNWLFFNSISDHIQLFHWRPKLTPFDRSPTISWHFVPTRRDILSQTMTFLCQILSRAQPQVMIIYFGICGLFCYTEGNTEDSLPCSALTWPLCLCNVKTSYQLTVTATGLLQPWLCRAGLFSVHQANSSWAGPLTPRSVT